MRLSDIVLAAIVVFSVASPTTANAPMVDKLNLYFSGPFPEGQVNNRFIQALNVPTELPLASNPNKTTILFVPRVVSDVSNVEFYLRIQGQTERWVKTESGSPYAINGDKPFWVGIVDWTPPQNQIFDVRAKVNYRNSRFMDVSMTFCTGSACLPSTGNTLKRRQNAIGLDRRFARIRWPQNFPPNIWC